VRLQAEALQAGYGERTVIDGLTAEIPEGKLTVIIGPNACGKSTLLKALARLLKPRGGAVLLDGRSIHDLPPREVAQRLGVLPQAPLVPEGITVADLVARGRQPYQRWWRQWSAEDSTVVKNAMAQADIADLADRHVDELSGGQRQRVWIAMALAQETEALLLDEPTTFLDLRYQIEILDLMRELADEHGVAVGVVLHDLNQAAAVADRIALLDQGRVRATGTPEEVLEADALTETYGIRIEVGTDPATGFVTTRPIGTHLSRVTTI